jgi:sporulation protein YlmC with PRC-barrel domain
MGPKLDSSKSLLKLGVVNDKGESLGRIEELLVDPETRQITYAILSYRGFPNRKKFLTVPWELLRFSAHDKKHILGIPRETIAKSAGYDSIEVLDHADTNWLAEKYQYYSNKPEWEARRQQEKQAELKRLEYRLNEIRGTVPKQEIVR